MFNIGSRGQKVTTDNRLGEIRKNTFGTEMDILHKLSKDDIESVVGEKVANTIIDAREGNIKIQSGGGGVYGKLTAS